MGFDSRHLVLEFLAENRSLNIQQMTLVFFGKKSDPFLQDCLKEKLKDHVYVYHNKGTRLFWKDYDFEKLSGTIIELLIDNQSSINLKKSEISFNITEPYYFLDLRNFDFEYLSIIPVIENSELVGFAMLYGNQLIEEVKYPLVSLKRLFRNIVKNEISAKYTEFNNVLAGKIGYLDFGNKLFLSNKLSEILNVDQKTEDIELVKELWENNNYHILDNYFINDYNVVELEKDNRLLLAIEELAKPKKVKEFTLFYILKPTDLELSEAFKGILKTVDLIFPKEKMDFYKVSDKSIAIFIGKKYLKKLINQFKLKLKNYTIIDVRSNSDIFPGANLKLVVDYLEDINSLEFNVDDYKNYRLKKEENKYNYIE